VSILVSASVLVVQVARTLTPTQQVKNAWKTIQLSGAYDISTTVDQYTSLTPAISNAGMQEQHQRFRIDGHIDESAQSSHIVITDVLNAAKVLEIRRERGRTYTRQGSDWIAVNTAQISQLNMLSLLAGIGDVSQRDAQQRIFAFTFDGNAFAEQMQRSLEADRQHGITHDAQWSDVSTNEQFRAGTGTGTMQIDTDGLPRSVSLELTFPATNQVNAARTVIETTYSNYARSGLALRRVMNQPFATLAQYLGMHTIDSTRMFAGMLIVCVALILGIIVLFMRRRIYLPLTIIVVGMLLYQPFSSLPRTYAATESRAPPSDTQSTPTVEFTPLASAATQGLGLALPLAGAHSETINGQQTNTRSSFARSNSSSSTADDDNDGLSNSEETRLQSNKDNSDSDADGLDDKTEYLLQSDLNSRDTDGDGLSDFAEVQIGTKLRNPDTDSDGIPDIIEVTVPSNYNGNTLQLYSNPLSYDTNGDGLFDGQECPEHIVASTTPITQIRHCRDSENDGIPDFLDQDNDNDDVRDAVDSSPEVYVTAVGADYSNNLHKFKSQPFTETAPYNLKVENIASSTAVRPLVVELQIVPINLDTTQSGGPYKHMYLHNAVHDWPSNDKSGQIQRTDDSTFASYLNSPYKGDPQSNKGDIRINAALEVQVPIGAAQYGGLPLNDCVARGSCAPASSTDIRPSWLDFDQLQAYGISAAYARKGDGSTNTSMLVLTVPLYPVEDPSTGSRVAYSATLYYESNGSNWLDAHKTRLQWVISSVQDYCPPKNDEPDPDCADDDRKEEVRVVQTYYGNWLLSGASVNDTVAPHETAVIVEDASKPAITTANKRRKEIVTVHTKLDEAFVSTPRFRINDPANQQTSIRHLLDARTNAALRTNNYGMDLASFVTTYKTYGSALESLQLYTVDMQDILNQRICANFGQSTSACTPEKIRELKQRCVDEINLRQDVRCRPAVLVASSSSERAISLSNTGTLTFADATPLESRSLVGQFFNVAKRAGTNEYTWQALLRDAVEDELNLITPYASDVSTPPSDTQVSNQLAQYANTLATVFVAIYTIPRVKSYTPQDITNAQAVLPAEFGDDITSTWGDLIVNVITEYADLMNLESEDENADDAVQRNTEGALDAADNVVSIIQSVFDLQSDWQTIDGTKKGFMGASALVVAAKAVVLGIGAFGNNQNILKNKQTISIVFNSVELAIRLAELVYEVTDFLETSRQVASGALAATTAVKLSQLTFKTIQTTWRAMGTAAKALTVIGVIVGVGVAVAGMAFAIKAARFGWEIGNAVASFVGQLVALAILTAISLAGPIGALVAAIIGALDAIATLVCSALSEKQQRSSAGQWLCGGISGLLANMFTWYKSSLVVDPDDQYSHKLEVEPDRDNIKLRNNLQGFVKDNAWNMRLSVVDKIEKMPFPATWMALPWFWQWLIQDERETDFRYQLNPAQIDQRGRLSIGSQYGSYTRISDPDFSWQLQQYVSYETPLTNTGINQKLSDLWLSKAWKAERQTCFVIWIFALFFVFPIPICYIEDQSDADYVNINESSQSIFDIFPATIDLYNSYRLVNTYQYTYAWSSASDVPAFPTFIDADNDGLNAETEQRLTSHDNQWDSDLDGVSDKDESIVGSSPIASDTDRDGMTDQEELIIGSNPTKLDSDGDGLTDGEEVVRVVAGQRVGGWDVAYDIVNDVPLVTWMGSDPTRADGDGDGIIDMREKIFGLSPYAKNSPDILAITGNVSEGRYPLYSVDFNDAANPGMVDASRINTTTTCIGGCSIENSVFRTLGIKLTGTQQLTAGGANRMLLSPEFTVSARIYARRNPSSQTLFDAIITQAGLFSLSRNDDGTIHIDINTETGRTQINTNYTVPALRPVTITVSYDGAVVIMYADGKEVMRTIVTGRPRDTDTSNNDLRIGGWQSSRALYQCGAQESNCSSYETGTSWQGSIDDVAVFATALTPLDIVHLHASTFQSDNDLIVRPGDSVVVASTLKSKLLSRDMQGTSSVSARSNEYAIPDESPLGFSLAHNASINTESVITVPGSVDDTQTTTTYKLGCTFANVELCLKLDETPTDTATRFTDLSNMSRHIFCRNVLCANYVESERAWKFTKDSSQRDYSLLLDVGVGNSISSRDFTVAFWYKPTESFTNKRTFLSNGKAGKNAFALYGQNTNPVGGEDMTKAIVPVFQIGESRLQASTGIPYVGSSGNSWTHIAFRARVIRSFMDGSTPKLEIARQIFVNGRNVSLSATDNSAIIDAPTEAFGTLILGNDTNNAASVVTGTNNYALGFMRDIQVYSAALNHQQIRTIASNCDDPWLLSCSSASTTTSRDDTSEFAQANNAGLTCITSTSCMATYRHVDGMAAYLHQHAFSISMTFQTSSTGDQTLWSTASPTSSNRITLDVSNGRIRFNYAAGSISTSDTISPNATYVVIATVDGLTMRLHVYRGVSQMETATATLNRLAESPLDPIVVGNSATVMRDVRVYRQAMVPRNEAAYVRYVFDGVIGSDLARIPQSDQIAVTNTASVKVISSDPNFEQFPLADTCGINQTRICMPFMSSDVRDYMGPVASAGSGTTTSSSVNANLAIDSNTANTLAVTSASGQPWYEIDLRSVKAIRTLRIHTDTSANWGGAIVALSNESLASVNAQSAVQSRAVTWQYALCGNQSTCTATTPPAPAIIELNFAQGNNATMARYVHVRIFGTNARTLSLKEIEVNPADSNNGLPTGTSIQLQACGTHCPAIQAGAARFWRSNRTYIDTNNGINGVFNPAKNMTLMGWFKFDTTTTTVVAPNTIPSKNGISIGVANGKAYLTTPTGAYTATTTLDINRWYHLAFVKQSNEAKVYVNGLSETLNSKVLPYNFQPATYRIGGPHSFWAAGVQLNDKALTTEEIRLAFQRRTQDLHIGFDVPAQSRVFSDTVNINLRLDCMSVCPQSGLPGRINDAVRFRGAQGLQLNSTTNDYVSQLFGQVGRYTISMWVKPSYYAQTVMGTNTGLYPTTAPALNLAIRADGTVEMRRLASTINNTYSTLASTTVVPLNQWSHVLYSFDQNTLRETLIVNQQVTYQTVSSAANFYRGPLTFGSGFVGELDAIDLRSEALTLASDANMLISQAPHWQLRFEESVDAEAPALSQGNAVSPTVSTPFLALPDQTVDSDTGTIRWGIARNTVAATCATTTTNATCPAFGIAGLRGAAVNFDGQESMLVVQQPTRIMSAMRDGGTVQLSVRPEAGVTGTQTLLRYGNDTTSALEVRITPEYYVAVKVGTYAYTSTTAIAAGWNHIAFTYGSNGFSYIQNGLSNTDNTLTSTVTLPVFTTIPDATLSIGGRMSGATVVNAFYGGIDDITFMPSRITMRKAFVDARQQMAMSTTKKQLDAFVVDADVAAISVDIPTYVPKLATNYLVYAVDPTSYVQTVNTTITAPNAQTNTYMTQSASCADDPSTHPVAFCPVFNTQFNNGIEGRYAITIDAYDIVNNHSFITTSTLLDDTPPVASIVPLPQGSSVYTVTRNLVTNEPMIHINVNVTDPTLRNANGAPGSGVKAVKIILYDISGRLITLIPLEARRVRTSNVWHTMATLPFRDPTGFYKVSVIATDMMNNTNPVELVVAGDANPIEVDGAPPKDIGVFPSPLIPNLYLVSNRQPATGSVSDAAEGRPALQKNLRVRLDFESDPEQDTYFDNRGDNKFVATCEACPFVREDSSLGNQRVALFNITGNKQAIRVINASNVITGTYTVALLAKITDSGTLVGSGVASNPRLRIMVERDSSYTPTAKKFVLKSLRGNTILRSTLKLDADRWYYVVFSESSDTLTLSVGTQLTAMTTTSMAYRGDLTINTPDLLIGAIASATTGTLIEDGFRGSIDDVLVSSFIVEPSELIGRSVALGSGVATHQTRLVMEDDGYAVQDTLSASLRYYTTVSQASLPILDSTRGTQSDICNGGYTREPMTCPTLSNGFAGTGITIQRESDGVFLAPQIVQGITDTLSTALRVRIDADTQTGRIASIVSTNPTDTALMVNMWYDHAQESIVVTIEDSDGTGMYEHFIPVTAPESGQWYHLGITSTRQNNMTVIATYLNGMYVFGFDDSDLRWQNPTIRVGGAENDGALHVRLDDISYFAKALDASEMTYLDRGMHAVVTLPFDNTQAVDALRENDDSVYHHEVAYLPGTTPFTITNGIIGSGALLLDGNDTVTMYDADGLTVPYNDNPWSLAAWIKPTRTTGELLRGSLDGYTYVLDFVADKLRFRMGSYEVTSQATYTLPSTAQALAVVYDGTNVKMYLDQQDIPLTVVETQEPFIPDVNIARRVTSTLSSTDGDNGAWRATDGNTNRVASQGSVALTQATANPSWMMDFGALQYIDAIDIYTAACCAQAMQELRVEVLGADNVQVLWSYQVPDSVVVAEKLRVTPPANTRGRAIRISIPTTGTATAQLGIAEVVVTQGARLIIGNQYYGMLDDIRIYQHALNANERRMLAQSGWRTSTLSNSINGNVWNTAYPENLEINAILQSVTRDNVDNRTFYNGEHTLWNGRVDTRNPQIIATETQDPDTGLYQYTIDINDRNLNPASVQTPCGERLDAELQQHNSVAYISRNSAVDGTLREPTRMLGSCEYGIIPDIIQVQRQQITTTNVLVAGTRYHYTTQSARIAVIDAHSPDTLIQRTIPVNGVIQSLVISSNKQTLVALSRAADALVISTYDISTTPDVPQYLGELRINTPVNVVDATMANDDTQLIILTDGTRQQLMNITLTNLSSPIQNLSRDVIMGTRGYALTSSHNVVSLAQGDDGVAFYQIDQDGTLQLAQVLQTSGYVHHVLAKDTYLYVIVDDVPLQNGIAPNVPNMVLTYAYLDSESYALASPLQPLSSYVHTSLSDDLYTVDAYHIRQIIPYLNNDVMMLSALATNEYCDVACQRISILDTTSVTPTLRSETQFRGLAQAIALAKNDVLVLQQGTTNNSAQLTSFQVSDRRWAATACDRASNCSEQAATSSMSSQLVRSAPLQAGAFMLNAMVAYTQTESLDFHFRADAPAGVLTMTLLIDNQPQLTHVPQNIQDDSIPPVSVEHIFTLPTLTTGRHVAQLVYRTASSPNVQVSPRYSFIVDTKAPSISIRDAIVGVQHLINDYLEVNVRIVDDSELLSYNVQNAVTAAIYPMSSTVLTDQTPTGIQQIILARVYVPRGSLSQPLIPITVEAHDKAGNVVSRRFNIQVDDRAPQLENAQVSANINGKMTPLTANSTITPTSTLDLHVNWSRISDISAITLRQLEYQVTTVIRSDAYDSAIPNTALRTPSLNTAEAARIQSGVRTSDSLDNSAVTRLPDIYVDSALTPDYTLFEETGPVYRGWLTNGCTVLGYDERTIARYDGQQFATTWDSQAVRFHWQGANWDTDGDLFIYIDSKIGGTVKAFRPDKYTKDLTTQQNDGESFIVLPANLAGRAVAPVGTSQALTDWRTRLFHAQNNRNTGIVEGADYVIYVGDTAHASLWAWNATTTTWELSESRPQYRFDTDNYVDNSDFRLEFSAIDYDPNTPFGVVAYATTESLFMPWASFPTTNPSRNSMYDDNIVVLPFINGYAWPSLSDNMCPRRLASIPSTTQIAASLVSTPSGASMRSVADAFANTEPDAVQMAIDETTPLCALLPDDSWCTTIRELQTTAMAGSSLLAGLRNINVQSQAPVLGNNSVVTYTLRIANTSAVATTTIYGIAQTYGGVWLTTSNNTNVTTGGNYTYHTVSDAMLRDYLILQIPPIAANGVYTVTLNGLIDIDKAQSLAEDRIATGDIAKVEIRLTDRNPQGNPLTNRTIEWLNATVRVDTQAPTNVIPSMHQVVRVGSSTISGAAVDESAISSVEIMYGYNNASLSQRKFCSVDASNQWKCALVIPVGSTSLKYRLRATDRYGLVGLWSNDYVTVVDTDRPAFVFDASTLSFTRSPLVGGSSLRLSGLISDSTSVGSLTVCDESQIACDTVDVTTITATTQSYTATQNLATAIDAQPCSALDFSDYTVYPLPQTAPATARVSDIAVEVRISHASAQQVELWLRSPSGTRVALVTSTRAAMTNMVAAFSDRNTTATTALQGSIATTASPVQVRPDGTLTTMVGETVNGTWAILACNRTASPLGAFVSSRLEITSQSQPRTINSTWEYTLNDTANLDGVVRTYSMWARDMAGNLSAQRRVSLKIDTVAPVLSVIPSFTSSISATQEINLFTGTIAEGSPTPPELYAKLYKDDVLVRTLPLSPTRTTNSSQHIQGFVSGRSSNVYTWAMPFDPSKYDKGIYYVQFYTNDDLGNSYVSSRYVFDNPAHTVPEIMWATDRPPFIPTEAHIEFALKSNYEVTTVNVEFGYDMPASDEITTTIGTWAYNASSDLVQSPSIAALQNEQLRQLTVGTHIGAALTAQGDVSMWQIAAGSAISTALQLQNVTQIALADDITARDTRLLVITNDGRIGQLITDTLTYPLGNTTAVQIDAGRTHNVALINTGQVVTWQTDDDGVTTQSISDTTHITQVSAGDGFTVTLDDAGLVHAWGRNNRGQVDVPPATSAPIIAIATGFAHTVALRSDGSVIAWGDNTFGQSTVPDTLTDVVYISAGAYNSAAVQSDGTVVIWGRNRITAPRSVNIIALGYQATMMEWKSFRYTLDPEFVLPASGGVQYKIVTISGIQPGRRYRYTITARNAMGTSIKSGVFFSRVARGQIFIPLITSWAEPVAPLGER
jgi:hypothetical protein